jgi:hypothetical protein
MEIDSLWCSINCPSCRLQLALPGKVPETFAQRPSRGAGAESVNSGLVLSVYEIQVGHWHVTTQADPSLCMTYTSPSPAK